MMSRFSWSCAPRLRARGGWAMWSAALLAVFVSAPSVFASDTTTYTYDALGRLRTVTVSGNQTSVQTYDYDAAGNRTQSTSGIVPSVPPSITVPASSVTGSYTISWGASTGTVIAYELYQATNASFSGQIKVYSGSGPSTSLSGRGNGTYYYRVRACSTSAACSSYRTGGNAITVTLPPGTPPSISVPSSSISGSYTISWSTSTGNVTAYELQEATNSSFTGAVLAYSGTGTSKAISGKGNGTYYYRVRACNTAAACSAYWTGTNPTSVTLPPSVPGAASVPAYNNTGGYTISWGASTGNVTAYELLESIAFGSETLIYSGTATSTAVAARADGVYSYRVRACNTSAACSVYTATQGNGAAVYVDKIAPTPPASVNMSAGYNLYWSGGSTDTAGAGAGSGVGSWRVYRNGSHIGTSSQPLQSFQDPAPPTNVTLNYTVRSVDRAGNESGNSPTYSIYIDTVPPTTPGNFRATSVSVNSVSLAWDASSDAFGISWYRIARSPGGSNMGNGNASTSFTDGTVSANTTYTYQVFAVDGHGVESSPASVTVTTPSGAPSVPVMGTPLFVQRTTGSFSVSWSASSGSVAYYVLEEDVNGGGAFASYASYQINVPATSKSFSGKGTSEYYYRVKACTSGGTCSGYSATKFILVCIGGCN